MSSINSRRPPDGPQGSEGDRALRPARHEPVSPERATWRVLDQHLQAEIAKWKPVIQAAGVYAD